MICAEKTKLMADYEKATKEFSEAVTLLNQKMGRVPKEEYDLLKIASEKSRVDSEQARVALEQHMARHKC